jgi:environmental stress-induced protein Ves
MLWKNGLGQTLEIDRFPFEGDTYLWRLSQAKIQSDGPFSNFPGMDRWLLVWQGNGLFLNEKKFELLDPIFFSGDENIFCRLAGGEVLDIGLIFNSNLVKTEMKVIEGSLELQQLADLSVHYIFDLKSGDTIQIDGAKSLLVDKSVVISIHKIR